MSRPFVARAGLGLEVFGIIPVVSQEPSGEATFGVVRNGERRRDRKSVV